jgi:hypothetical protein
MGAPTVPVAPVRMRCICVRLLEETGLDYIPLKLGKERPKVPEVDQLADHDGKS